MGGELEAAMVAPIAAARPVTTPFTTPLEGKGNGVFDHLGVYVSDLRNSARLYTSVLAELGITLLQDHTGADGSGRLVFGTGAPRSPFFVLAHGRPAHWQAQHTIGLSPMHIAFAAPSRAAVDAFHATGVRCGALNNGEPGVRSRSYYCAFLVDGDGNNVEAGVYL